MKQLKPLDLEELTLVSGGCDAKDLKCGDQEYEDEEEGGVIQ